MTLIQEPPELENTHLQSGPWTSVMGKKVNYYLKPYLEKSLLSMRYIYAFFTITGLVLTKPLYLISI